MKKLYNKLYDTYLSLHIFRKQKYTQASTHGHGMKWYNWTIWFRYVLEIIFLTNGLIYAVKTTDITFYSSIGFLLLFSFYIANIYSWIGMIFFRKSAIIFYFILNFSLQLIVLLISVIYPFNNIIYILGNTIFVILFELIEINYYKKRLWLFDSHRKNKLKKVN